MCGIAGFCTSIQNNSYTGILQSMIDEIRHRGPDGDGIQLIHTGSQELIGLGHKRLSIIDLTASGRQPMNSVSGQTTIIFNGEIYNYRILRKELEKDGWAFRTNTDTEVILNLYEKYGEDCLQYLNGMFAFSIYDHKKEQLFIARDRLGIRPLYYTIDSNGSFIYASEIKALWKFPTLTKKVNNAALYEYAQSRYVSNPETVFDGVTKLQPGHYMIVKNGHVELKPYWNIQDFEKGDLSLSESIDHLEKLFLDSIQLRMISDVPVGAFLSGGLDSSLIVAMMSKYSSHPVKTFSVGFEDERYSELKYAKKVAEMFNTDHQELYLRPSDFRDSLYKVASFRDAPVSETADIPLHMLSVLAKKQVSVILTGEGSDELFAGYPKYAFDQYSKSAGFQTFLDNKWSSKLINTLPYRFRKIKLAYNTLCIKDDWERFNRWFASFGNETVDSLFSEQFKNDSLSRNSKPLFLFRGNTNLDRMQYLDVKHWLSDNLLERGDRMLMAASVEGRLPFLDYRLAEFAFQLPESYKIKRFEQKYIIKKLAERYLSKENIYRKKVGFYIPVGDWFKKEMKDFLCDHLLSSSFRDRGIFNTKKVEQMISSHCDGITNYEKELWMLLNLEIWFRACVD